MNSAELKVVRFEGGDVIATSVPGDAKDLFSKYNAFQFVDAFNTGYTSYTAINSILQAGWQWKNLENGASGTEQTGIEYNDYETTNVILKGGESMKLSDLMNMAFNGQDDTAYNGTYYYSTKDSAFHFLRSTL